MVGLTNLASYLGEKAVVDHLQQSRKTKKESGPYRGLLLGGWSVCQGAKPKTGRLARRSIR